jgi:hypothetical protein
LNVEGTSDIQSISNLSSGLLDTLNGGWFKILWGQDQSGIARVDTSVLNVLRDKVTDDFLYMC